MTMKKKLVLFPTLFEADQRYVRTEEESVRNDNNDGIPTSLSSFDIDQRY